MYHKVISARFWPIAYPGECISWFSVLEAETRISGAPNKEMQVLLCIWHRLIPQEIGG